MLLKQAISSKVIQNLRCLQGVPSVQMYPPPPDFILNRTETRQEQEDRAPDKRSHDLTKEGAIQKEHPLEFFDSDRDHDRNNLSEKVFEPTSFSSSSSIGSTMGTAEPTSQPSGGESSIGPSTQYDETGTISIQFKPPLSAERQDIIYMIVKKSTKFSVIFDNYFKQSELDPTEDFLITYRGTQVLPDHTVDYHEMENGGQLDVTRVKT